MHCRADQLVIFLGSELKPLKVWIWTQVCQLGTLYQSHIFLVILVFIAHLKRVIIQNALVGLKDGQLQQTLMKSAAFRVFSGLEIERNKYRNRKVHRINTYVKGEEKIILDKGPHFVTRSV